MMTVSQSIAAYVAAQTANDDAEDALTVTINTEVAALIAQLNAINNSPGTLSPADQASLDNALVRGNTIVTNLTALSAVATPPAPVVPPAAGNVVVP